MEQSINEILSSIYLDEKITLCSLLLDLIINNEQRSIKIICKQHNGIDAKHLSIKVDEAQLLITKLYPNFKPHILFIDDGTNTSSNIPNNTNSNSITQNKISINNVQNIILIISGKGGVGKSTIATNLALALNDTGKDTSLLDCDIYGPSIPILMGMTEYKEPEIQNNMFSPPNKDGVNVMSSGLLVDNNVATIWRGPMITKMVQHLFERTDWRKHHTATHATSSEYLIVDTPPGTGDVHLTIAKRYNISGAIAVTTPDKLALADTHKSIDMLQKLNIDVIGMVENMTNKNNSNNNIVKNYCKQHNINLLASVPIDPTFTTLSNEGMSIFSKQSKEYTINADIIKQPLLSLATQLITCHK